MVLTAPLLQGRLITIYFLGVSGDSFLIESHVRENLWENPLDYVQATLLLGVGTLAYDFTKYNTTSYFILQQIIVSSRKKMGNTYFFKGSEGLHG